MSIRFIIWRNLKKNIRNYYLYVFALVFSVALYFSFVTLQYDPAMDEMKGTMKGGAAIGASSVVLVAIVAVFLLYANIIFIKRRSREIGLFQLIGLTKGKIFGLLSAENIILYFGSMLAGIGAGFVVSRLILMILFKIIGVDAMAKLRFSPEALEKTTIVFATIYLLIMVMNYLFIKRQTILSLFRVTSTAQERVKRISVWDIIIGVLGLAFIGAGYAYSARLFSGDLTSMTQLMIAMITILGLVIIGSYLFYKGSVRFLFNLIRKGKNGYLSINQVLSLSSIMFRMRSNALLLTVITTVSALAIGLLSLSYISFYSTDKMAKEHSPHDFGFVASADGSKFTGELKKSGIGYNEVSNTPLKINVDLTRFIDTGSLATRDTQLSVISDKSIAGSDIAPGEARFIISPTMERFLAPKHNGQVELLLEGDSLVLAVTDISNQSVLPYKYGEVLVVDESDYQKVLATIKPDTKSGNKLEQYQGIELTDKSQMEEANRIFQQIESESNSFSQYQNKMDQRTNMGLIMFIVGFLGLTFLITSGCILYFKQMDESEEEKAGYTILRKLGFTQVDLLRGIQFKQMFNFGIPLVVGLSHSYFAVKSGWFFFGTEMMTPTILVMLLYTALYSIFGLLSVLYYKRVIQEAL